MDFPAPSSPPELFVHPWTHYGVIPEAKLFAGTGQPASTTWVANLGIFQPVVIPWTFLVNRVFWMNGATLTGPPNADFGVYTADGTRLFSVGPTAQSGASALQFVTLGTPYLLGPGRYYFGLSSSGSTALFGAVAPTAPALRNMGVLQQGSVATLPANATFAAASNALLPMCGIARTTAG